MFTARGCQVYWKKRCKPSQLTWYVGRFERETSLFLNLLIVVILTSNRELNNFCIY